ncbi:HK97 gp10 family phage protein [Lacticaseibacillus brantae]|uniref:HK97 gp10 family phage protein n=1 Tax=Lacticaseibacillus brantae DSM 23927 TaxID=1423727 RepID=A0A0R2B0A0_9LACO|nr:HK97 gp10 family phage protein [Lacticaseibacillus brantae]KRM73009.1 hypothetical protein FC34_GL000729 [Lacticaseibacillus brantae DSM 23927]
MAIEIDLSDILDSYSKEVADKVKEIQDDVADEAVSTLQSTSPKKAGKYAKGWAKQRDGNTVRVYNKTHAGLTHLLENGHAKKDGGRTQAQPHIGPAAAAAAKSFESKIRQELG